MNYKHLGKYHYIYRFYFSSDGVANIEKFPIVYSNQHYLYVKENGTYELKRLCLTPTDSYSRGDIFIEFNEKIAEYIKNRYGHNIAEGYASPMWWFLLDDISQVEEFARTCTNLDCNITYYEKLISRKKYARETLLDQIKKSNDEIAKYEHILAKIELEKKLKNGQ